MHTALAVDYVTTSLGKSVENLVTSKNQMTSHAHTCLHKVFAHLVFELDWKFFITLTVFEIFDFFVDHLQFFFR